MVDSNYNQIRHILMGEIFRYLCNNIITERYKSINFRLMAEEIYNNYDIKTFWFDLTKFDTEDETFYEYTFPYDSEEAIGRKVLKYLMVVILDMECHNMLKRDNNLIEFNLDDPVTAKSIEKFKSEIALNDKEVEEIAKNKLVQFIQGNTYRK